MKIDEIYEKFKNKKTDIPAEAKKNLENVAFESQSYLFLNAAIISLIAETAGFISFKNIDVIMLFLIVPLMFIALTGITYGFISLIVLGLQQKCSTLSKFSKFMPYNLLSKILPTKITRKINNFIFDDVLPDSLIEVEDLKELSNLVEKEDMNRFLRICGGKPTYKKMMDYFESEELESIREEKITLLTESLYDTKALNVKE